MQDLLDALNYIYPLSEDLREHLKMTVEVKEFSKGQYLLKAGRVCENVYFVGEGLLRSFYLKKNGKEENKWFMKKHDVVYAVRSFLDKIPSTENIQALEPTTVYFISHKALEETYQKYLIFNIHGRILTEKYYKLSEEREEIMRMPEATDRYNYFLEHFTDLTNRLPDKHLATFLRMSPVWICRLRNKRTEKVKKVQ